MPNIPFLSA